MKKIEKYNLNNVSGGYVRMKIDPNTYERFIRVYDDVTDELLLSHQLFGQEAENIGSPSDQELIAAALEFDDNINYSSI